MASFENCLHCGHQKRISLRSLHFVQAGKTLELDLCADCRATLLAEDDITSESRKST